MKKPSQIAIDALLSKIQEREQQQAEIRDTMEGLQVTYDLAQEDIDELKAAIELLEKGVRKVRSDKGAHRNGHSVPAAEVGIKIQKTRRGRNKRVLTQYDPSATFEQKVVFVIKEANRFLHNREIAERLYAHDPAISKEYSVNRLSGIAARFAAKGDIVLHKEGGSTRNTFYGLPLWKDGDKITKGHEFDPKMLVGKSAALPINMESMSVFFNALQK